MCAKVGQAQVSGKRWERLESSQDSGTHEDGGVRRETERGAVAGVKAEIGRETHDGPKPAPSLVHLAEQPLTRLRSPDPGTHSEPPGKGMFKNRVCHGSLGPC